MDIKDFAITKKTKEAMAKEKLCNAMFDVDKFNTIYTLGAIDMLQCLLQVGENRSWSHDELLNGLKSYQDAGYVAKSKELKEYLDILIKNHMA